MASPPLFDLTSIDFDGVMISAEEVGKINPQCGPMRQLDHVIWHDADGMRALGVKHATSEEFWIPYHIPGRPLMPGVLMIEAVAQLCSIQFRLRTGADRFVGFTRCNNVIFRGQVVPGDVLHLLSREKSFNPRRLISNTQGIVGDNIVFEAEITGMII